MYQFEHEGKNVKLLPCPPKIEQAELNPVAAKKTNSVSLISAKVFSQDVERGASFMILTIRELNKEPRNPIPPKVTPLITEFDDVFPDDLPDKLPLMRDPTRH